MNKIELDQIHRYHDHNAFFHTQEGIVVDIRSKSPLIPFSQLIKHLKFEIESVYLDHNLLIVKCFNVFFESSLQHHDYKVLPDRVVLNESNGPTQNLVLRAIHWITWHTQSNFCGSCGSVLHLLNGLFEKKCTACEKSYYPNLAPAVMVLVQRKDEILLVRSPHFKQGIYSAIAGFIDIGESAERAAHREAKEEVGITLSKLEYFNSQSWPFPNSFMIAFKAQYLDGTLEIDGKEIEDAKWFKLNKLPLLPSHPSIARQLIESVITSPGLID